MPPSSTTATTASTRSTKSSSRPRGCASAREGSRASRAPWNYPTIASSSPHCSSHSCRRVPKRRTACGPRSCARQSVSGKPGQDERLSPYLRRRNSGSVGGDNLWLIREDVTRAGVHDDLQPVFVAIRLVVAERLDARKFLEPAAQRIQERLVREGPATLMGRTYNS